MTPSCTATQLSTPNSAFEGNCNNNYYSNNDNFNTEILSLLELVEIALYTIQKINNYPPSFGKTVENYFHFLFPDEIKTYLTQRQINSGAFKGIGVERGHSNEYKVKVCRGTNIQNKVCQSQTMSAQVKQVRDIRNLCKLFVEQQDGILMLISEMLDKLETGLSDLDTNERGTHDGKQKSECQS